MIYKEFTNFIAELEAELRAASGNYNIIIEKPIFQDFIKWYQIAKGVKPNVNGCGVCLYEHYHNLKNMKAERLTVTHLPKNGQILWFDGRPYSRQSEHLTQAIVDFFLKEWPDFMEPNEFLPVHPDLKPEPKAVKETHKQRK